jgi:pilus assembly protein CpaB
VSRRRRGALLVGLALLLGALAAADVGRREAAVDRRLAPLVDVVVARRDLPADTRLAPAHLAVRRVPARYAPVGAAGVPAELVGQSLAVAVPRGGYLAAGQIAEPSAPAGAPVRAGERAAEVVASGSRELVVPGARVDVLVTRETGGAAGGAELALQDVEVLAASAAPDDGRAEAHPGDRVAATLRVTLRQAVFLSAAQAFARDVRLLPRAAGDRRRSGAVSVGEDLR